MHLSPFCAKDFAALNCRNRTLENPAQSVNPLRTGNMSNAIPFNINIKWMIAITWAHCQWPNCARPVLPPKAPSSIGQTSTSECNCGVSGSIKCNQGCFANAAPTRH